MKIIRVSNFDNENYAQSVAAQFINNREEGKVMVDALRNTCDGNSPTYYRLVDDSYILWRGMAEFVDNDEYDYANDLAWMVN